MSALFIRERLSIGQELQVSQLGAMLNVMADVSIVYSLWIGRPFPRQERAKARNPLYSWYRCGDGRWLALVALFDRDWPPFYEAIGRPELGRDPRFQDEPSRTRHCQELVAILDQVFARPQVLANEYVKDWDHPTLGKLQFLGYPVQFSPTPATLKTGAPGLGQHTEEVLTPVAGYTQKELARLKEEGVIP